MLISLLVWNWDVCVWDTWLNLFWVIDQLYWDYFLVTLMGLKCWFIIDDFMLWHVLTRLFWSLQSILFALICLFGFSLRTNGYCDLFWDTLRLLVENWWILWFILRYFAVSRWESMDIVIYHWYGYCDLFWDTLRLLIESRWILWLIIDAFSFW